MAGLSDEHFSHLLKSEETIWHKIWKSLRKMICCGETAPCTIASCIPTENLRLLPVWWSGVYTGCFFLALVTYYYLPFLHLSTNFKYQTRFIKLRTLEKMCFLQNWIILNILGITASRIWPQLLRKAEKRPLSVGQQFYKLRTLIYN